VIAERAMSMQRPRWTVLAALIVTATLASSAPRLGFFDHPLVDSMIGRTPGGAASFGDDHHYHQQAQYFRGEAARSALKAPWAYRVGLPALVAALPFDIDITFRCLNTAALILANIVLALFCLSLGSSSDEAVAAGALSAMSFGTFWYGPTDYPDAFVLLALTLCLHFLHGRKRTAFWIACSIGVLFKEWVLMMLPVVVTLDVLEEPRWAARVRTLLPCAAPIAVAALLRYGFRDLPQHMWVPSIDVIIANLSRPRAILSTILTLGVALPLVPAAYALRSLWWERWSRAGAGRILAITAFWFSALPAYGLVSAYLDGRFVWMLYPVVMPLAGAGLCASVSALRRHVAAPASHDVPLTAQGA
jgi:hypothetical protein